ncbi:hypothetical protein BGZ83_007539 [Gryganskiella cystojenkinii]|nr:hypothetical protein BGZ83_007539 [Gryganskiella cystojenkinii]
MQTNQECLLETVNKAYEGLAATKGSCKSKLVKAKVQLQKAMANIAQAQADTTHLYHLIETLSESQATTDINYKNQIDQLLEALRATTAENQSCQAALKASREETGGSNEALTKCTAALREAQNKFVASQALLQACNDKAAKSHADLLRCSAKHQVCQGLLEACRNGATPDLVCMEELARCRIEQGTAQDTAATTKEELRQCLQQEAQCKDGAKANLTELSDRLEQCQVDDNKCSAN